MKRIFIVQNTPLGEPLPLSVYLTDLLRNFKKNKKFEINLIVGNSSDIPKEIRELCNKIYQLNSSTYSIKDNIKFSLDVFSILRKENKKNKIDIVHCFYPNSSLLGAVMFKTLIQKCKIIYDVRSPWIDMSIGRGHVKKMLFLYKAVLNSEEKFLCKFVDNFIFITKGLEEHYKNNLNVKNCPVLISPSGVDLKKFKKLKSNIRKKYGILEEEILIGHIGSIDKLRELGTFIQLFSSLPNNTKLMFVGGGDSLEDLKKLVKELNLDKRVIFIPKVPHKEVSKYISSFEFGLCHLPNIFIFSSCVPIKILEYLSCDVPVLASYLKAHIDLSKDLKGIHIYKNSKDILNIMNKGRSKKFKNNFKDYSWEEITKKYENVWRRL